MSHNLSRHAYPHPPDGPHPGGEGTPHAHVHPHVHPHTHSQWRPHPPSQEEGKRNEESKEEEEDSEGEGEIFTFLFPHPTQPQEILHSHTLPRAHLTPRHLASHVPRGYVFVGVQDEDGFDLGDDLASLEPGTYTVTYNVAPPSQAASSLPPSDATRAHHAVRLLLAAPSPQDILPAVREEAQREGHDWDALAVGEAHRQDTRWSYTLSRSEACVVVALHCDARQLDFLHLDHVVPFASALAQGQGALHPLAYELASSLPWATLATLCRQRPPSSPRAHSSPTPPRHLLFTGQSMSGMVAHVAALLAREQAPIHEAGIEVGAIAWGSPHGMSTGICEALDRTGLKGRHVTYCQAHDVMLRIYQLALDVQVARAITHDTVFDAASLMEHVQFLQSHQAAQVAQGWDAVQLAEREALDMLDSHAAAARASQFVPVGSFGWAPSPSQSQGASGLTWEEDAWVIQEHIRAIPLRQSDLRVHHQLPPLPPCEEVLVRAHTLHVEDLNPALRPTITQCRLLASPGHEGQAIPPKIDIRVHGHHLESVLQRQVSGHVRVAYASDPPVGSMSPLCLQDKGQVHTGPSSCLLVSSAWENEVKLSLSHAWLGETEKGENEKGEKEEKEETPSSSSPSSSPSTSTSSKMIALTLRNDFGESEVFHASGHTLDQKDMPALQVFSSFNSEILMTSFSRSLLLLYAAPSYYLQEGQDGSCRTLREDRLPPALQYLCEIECLFLHTDHSQLRAIVEQHAGDPRMLHVAIHAARTRVNEIIGVLLLPLQFKCDNKLKQLTKKALGGLGTVVGGAITLVGGTLAVPGLLMALVPIIGALASSSHSASTAWTVAAVPGMLLSLPGIGICGLGSWLAVRSWRATRDKPTLQYSQILRFSLECLLYGNGDQVLDEVPALEESVIQQFHAWAHLHTPPSQPTPDLWTVSDEQLHSLLGQAPPVENGTPLYAAIKPVDQAKLRHWLRAIGRIYRMRQLMESFLVVGFVGVHNAGKSSWIRRLFHLDVMADSIQRTESVDLHPLPLSDGSPRALAWQQHNPSALKVGVVDFPGSSDEREAIALLSERLAHVTTLFVCVFRWGHIARAEKEVIDMVKRSERDFVVLINQCDVADDLAVREAEYRANYAQVLEVDPALLHFVSATDSSLDGERVRHLLWGHLQLLVQAPADAIQLAMNLLPPPVQEDILAHLPSSLESSLESTESSLESSSSVQEYLHEKAVAPFLKSRAGGEELFQHQELYQNLPLVTRFQPIQPLTTAYDAYPSPDLWRRMEFLDRAQLFREHTPPPHSILSCTMLQMDGKSAYQSLQAGLLAIPKRELHNGIRIHLLDDKAIDAGGPIRAVFRAAAKQVQEGQVPFLKVYDNYSVYLHPLGGEEGLGDGLRALGRMVGMVILQELTFPANFALPLFKLILGQPLSFLDYEALDRQDAQSIRQICQMDLADIEDLALTFSATYPSPSGEQDGPQEVDLVPGGRAVDVTQANLTEYLRTYVRHRLGAHLPLKALVLGVQDVVPRDKLCLFSPQMLQLLVNGIQDYSVEELRSSSVVTGVAASVEGWFWEALQDMTDEDRALFLTFVTGTSVLPAAGLDPPLQIKVGKGSLPKSHTCFNTLELPPYESAEQLTANLLFAIRNADTMDFGMV